MTVSELREKLAKLPGHLLVKWEDDSGVSTGVPRWQSNVNYVTREGSSVLLSTFPLHSEFEV